MNDEYWNRYQAGRTITEVEYGVRLPDGTVEWETGYSFRRLGSVGDRKEYLAERERRLVGTGIKDPGVVFLSRVKKTKFSDPEIVQD